MDDVTKDDGMSVDFAAWLRMERARMGGLQREVATALGISTVTLRAWEQGRSRPVKIASLDAIANWSGRVTVHDVLVLVRRIPIQWNRCTASDFEAR